MKSHLIFTLALLSMNVLSNNDNLLVIKCSNEYYFEDVVFIWDRKSNSLIGTTIEETIGIPYKSSDRLRTIFEKVPPEISGATPKFTYIFKEYVNTLEVIIEKGLKMFPTNLSTSIVAYEIISLDELLA